jgi:hypothetical protein
MGNGVIEGDWVKLSEIIGWTRGQKARLGANRPNRGEDNGFEIASRKVVNAGSRSSRG